MADTVKRARIEWAGYAAALWSLAYGALGLYWSMGGPGFPFGMAAGRGGQASILAGARAEAAAPIIAGLGLVGMVVALAMGRAIGRGPVRGLLLAFGWAAAAGLALVIPDFRVMAFIAYLPILVIGAPFGWPAGANLREALPWPIVNQAVCIAGGLLWAVATLVYQRRTRDACPACGRTDVTPAWTTPAMAARWGRWAVAIAVGVPIVYAVTRWAWALGIPLGITEEFLRLGQANGMWRVGAALGTLALGGAVLTLGLTRRWGETVPRWIPFAAGRRVPPFAAIVPAALVSVIVTSAGLMFTRMSLADGLILGETTISLDENSAALFPELLWPVWGVALAAATLAYYYRRRGRCRRCGRL